MRRVLDLKRLVRQLFKSDVKVLGACGREGGVSCQGTCCEVAKVHSEHKAFARHQRALGNHSNMGAAARPSVQQTLDHMKEIVQRGCFEEVCTCMSCAIALAPLTLHQHLQTSHVLTAPTAERM